MDPFIKPYLITPTYFGQVTTRNTKKDGNQDKPYYSENRVGDRSFQKALLCKILLINWIKKGPQKGPLSLTNY